MFCCLTASTARALLCTANAEFGIHLDYLTCLIVGDFRQLFKDKELTP